MFENMIGTVGHAICADRLARALKDARTTDNRQGFVHVGGVSRIPEQDHFESFVARESVRLYQS